MKDLILKLVEWGELNQTALMSFCGLNMKKHITILDTLELNGLVSRRIQVNGKKISRLSDIQDALKAPKDGFHTIEFMQGDGLQKIVLDAEGLDAATGRILERFGIEKPFVIAGRP